MFVKKRTHGEIQTKFNEKPSVGRLNFFTRLYFCLCKFSLSLAVLVFKRAKSEISEKTSGQNPCAEKAVFRKREVSYALFIVFLFVVFCPK